MVNNATSNSSDSMPFTVRPVKTKTSDGGTSTRDISHTTSDTDMASTETRSTSPPNRNHDAFSYYSNNQVRIRTLTLADRSNNNQEETQPQQHHEERKTRISFELHPSLILEDLIVEGLFDGDEDDAGIDDILDLLQDNLRARSNSPRSVADAKGTNFSHDDGDDA